MAIRVGQLPGWQARSCGQPMEIRTQSSGFGGIDGSPEAAGNDEVGIADTVAVEEAAGAVDGIDGGEAHVVLGADRGGAGGMPVWGNQGMPDETACCLAHLVRGRIGSGRGVAGAGCVSDNTSPRANGSVSQ